MPIYPSKLVAARVYVVEKLKISIFKTKVGKCVILCK